MINEDRSLSLMSDWRDSLLISYSSVLFLDFLEIFKDKKTKTPARINQKIIQAHPFYVSCGVSSTACKMQITLHTCGDLLMVSSSAPSQPASNLLVGLWLGSFALRCLLEMRRRKRGREIVSYLPSVAAGSSLWSRSEPRLGWWLFSNAKFSSVEFCLWTAEDARNWKRAWSTLWRKGLSIYLWGSLWLVCPSEIINSEECNSWPVN